MTVSTSTSPWRPSSLSSSAICTASSARGSQHRRLNGTAGSHIASSGSPKEAVCLVPVLAWPRTSLPATAAAGISLPWMSVGFWKPAFADALHRCSGSSRASNPCSLSKISACAASDSGVVSTGLRRGRSGRAGQPSFPAGGTAFAAIRIAVCRRAFAARLAAATAGPARLAIVRAGVIGRGARGIAGFVHGVQALQSLSYRRPKAAILAGNDRNAHGTSHTGSRFPHPSRQGPFTWRMCRVKPFRGCSSR